MSALEKDSRTEGGRDSCRGTKAQAMEQMLRRIPLKVMSIPWRNNNLSTLHVEPPLSEQGETFIGIYLLALGKATIRPKLKPVSLDRRCGSGVSRSYVDSRRTCAANRYVSYY